ncbi:MAG: folate-binding protein YgfZ [Rhodospirillales bacterium]|nr:folate-binding protein YgfZ [Rhodospirillales bacterium]MCB9980161.1 folate-binding protein YgfZ [Rhodospirillales bacterium]
MDRDFSDPIYVPIPDRGLIRISGHDRFQFLQGLITNDITRLQTSPSLYSCLLTPNGKFLFDFFVTEDGDSCRLECEGGERAQHLLQKLKMYQLRADVTLEMEEERRVIYALLFPPSVLPSHAAEDSGVETSYPDPRHPRMGLRTLDKPHSIPAAPFDIWDSHRIKLGIPDGSRDMSPEKSTLLECGIDTFHGVSFDKGCYMGQELTARMHHRALTKKALVPVQFDGPPPPPFSDLRDDDGALIGEMRSSCGSLGLALLRKDVTLRVGAANNGMYLYVSSEPELPVEG